MGYGNAPHLMASDSRQRGMAGQRGSQQLGLMAAPRDPHALPTVPRGLGGSGMFRGADDDLWNASGAAFNQYAQQSTAARNQIERNIENAQVNRGMGTTGQHYVGGSHELPGAAMARQAMAPGQGQGLLAGVQVPRAPAVAPVAGPTPEQERSSYSAWAGGGPPRPPAPAPRGPNPAMNAAGGFGNPVLSSQAGWGNLADRARFAARRPTPAIRPPGAPPAVAPVAMPAPGSIEHFMAAQDAYRANPSMRTASGADAAEKLFYHMQEEAHRRYQDAQLRAQTQGMMIQNEGLPDRQQAELQGLRGQNQQQAIQNQMLGETAALGPIGRALGSLAGSVPEMFPQFQNFVRGLTPPPPGAPGRVPTGSEARGILTGGPAPLIPQADLDRITGPVGNLRLPSEAYGMAYQLGYGPKGMDDPHSALSDALRAHFKSLYKPDEMVEAQRSLRDPAMRHFWQIGWLAPSESAIQASERSASWFRGGRPPGYPASSAATPPRVQLPPPPRVQLPPPPSVAPVAPPRPRVGPSDWFAGDRYR